MFVAVSADLATLSRGATNLLTSARTTGLSQLTNVFQCFSGLKTFLNNGRKTLEQRNCEFPYW
jgi:hypothetical protein